ncbi:MAG: DNA pilot protein [Microviridae sp.]|nr:MAG: DNA pilot protein [Microviridae sp.]
MSIGALGAIAEGSAGAGFFSSMSPAVSGGLVAGGLGLLGQVSANKQSESNASAQMSFQASQSASQYQRAVADMKAAGINPMLASQVGGNAALSGAMGNVGNVGSAAVNAAQQGALLSANIEQTQAQTEALKAAAVKSKTSAGVDEASVGEIASRIANNYASLPGNIAGSSAAQSSANMKSNLSIVSDLVTAAARGVHRGGAVKSVSDLFSQSTKDVQTGSSFHDFLNYLNVYHPDLFGQSSWPSWLGGPSKR